MIGTNNSFLRVSELNTLSILLKIIGRENGFVNCRAKLIVAQQQHQLYKQGRRYFI
jgi:hypothetical protein